jgi:septal ring factor EnvC (AmiA/AmiB activator)
VAALATTGVDEVELARAVALPEALGFEATSREAAPAAPPDLHVVPDPDADEKARIAAQERLDAAEEALAEAQEAYDGATTEVENLEARSMQVQAEIDELKRKLAELEETYEGIDDELGDAEDARSEADAHLRSATKDRDRLK